MAKIAVESGKVAPPEARLLARGEGWSVSDVVCSAGPHSLPFEERHASPSMALVVSGTFQYRGGTGCELMTPGSILLGSAGQSFECGHEHGTGDRCLAFSFTTEFFDRLASDAGAPRSRPGFKARRLPPLRELSPLAARASASLAGLGADSWEELGIQLAAMAAQLDDGVPADPPPALPGALARVTRVVRMMAEDSAARHDLAELAREARLSPYHFLRTFESLTGVTPHQFLLRTRLRQAAMRVRAGNTAILDIALDCGFGDVSNFNRAFRAEFGVSPRRYRANPAYRP